MGPRGVLFDFDGVIADSLSSHLEAWSKAYLDCFQLELDPAIYKEIIGHSASRIALVLAANAGEKSRSEELKRKKIAWLEKFEINIPLLPGVREVFAFLEKTNIPYGIASNAPSDFLLRVLRHNGLKPVVALGREDAPRPKPAPDPYLLCARKLGIPFRDHPYTYVLEDSVHGLEAAVEAKMLPIGITSQSPAELLVKAGAKKTFPDLAAALDAGIFAKLPSGISLSEDASLE